MLVITLPSIGNFLDKNLFDDKNEDSTYRIMCIAVLNDGMRTRRKQRLLGRSRRNYTAKART